MEAGAPPPLRPLCGRPGPGVTKEQSKTHSDVCKIEKFWSLTSLGSTWFPRGVFWGSVAWEFLSALVLHLLVQLIETQQFRSEVVLFDSHKIVEADSHRKAPNIFQVHHNPWPFWGPPVAPPPHHPNPPRSVPAASSLPGKLARSYYVLILQKCT